SQTKARQSMRTFFLGLALTAASALAQGSDDLDALQRADQAQSVPASASDWHSFVEVALGQAATPHGPTLARQRLSFDLQFDQRFAPEWRAVFSDRLDLNWQQQPGLASVDKDVNTIRDAYLSWQPQAHQLLDAGRINVPYGAASGYNPSDYFRDYAVRSAVSVDPSSLKKNRMGSVMLRGQQLWDSGSLTAHKTAG
ncbi:MAG: hypothetical protein NTY70_17185, partial [Burkholderiales bacterium]|nr:hypothetical protein [Burkholderiales bacterium]